MSHSRSAKLYIGNLPPDVRPAEVERIFKKYGRIRDVDVKNRHESSFAFIEFESSRDAEDAMYGRNNYRYDGKCLKVEISKGGNRRNSSGGGYRGSYNGRYDDRGSSTGRNREKRFRTKARSTEWRLKVTGLPSTASWQDLKDHMKAAGEVSYADVYRNGTGVCDYHNEDDLSYALKTLENSELKTFKGDIGRIHLERDFSVMKRSRSRSKSASRSRSPRSRSKSARKFRRSSGYSGDRNNSASSSRSSST